MRNSWFPFQKEESMCEKVLFCFHHAGGAASCYHPWEKWSEELEVVPCELPGNGCRMSEKFCFDMKWLVQEVSREIYKYSMGRKVYLYGHSLGALMAFLVCHELEHQYRFAPELLIVAGRHAPQEIHSKTYHSDMGLDALERELRRLGGTPEEVFEDPEVRAFLLKKVRKSYQINESFVYQEEIINTDIIAHCGTKDEDATWDMIDRWREVTNGDFYAKSYEGGHFFGLDQGRDYFSDLTNQIKGRKR
ncbi:MAG: thioesterase [Lachnospiraceae bacterium]|jgi:hypothetical protein|nr:thioesterase [Lachnospiraceae bacterium]